MTETDTRVPTVDIQTGEGMRTVLAEATDTPGLLVTPELAGGEFTGAFTITHAASGLSIPMGWDGDHLETVRGVARSLGATPVDWTASRESIAEQVAEHQDAVKAARHNATYPVVAAEPIAEQGGYPLSEEQATADGVARHLTSGLRYRTRDTWEIVKRNDKDGREIHMLHSSALVAEWALVLALREFAKVDKQAADWTAREIWNGWEAGDAPHEMSWDWAREYGLPILAGTDDAADKATAAREANSASAADSLDQFGTPPLPLHEINSEVSP